METIVRIGLDTSKSVFQLHGVDRMEQPVAPLWRTTGWGYLRLHTGAEGWRYRPETLRTWADRLATTFDDDDVLVYFNNDPGGAAVVDAVLFAEAVYLLGFSSASYRSNVNRRLKLSKDQPDREAILVQLRRERGLTGDGMFRGGMQWFNRLLLESGMTRGAMTLALVALVAGGGVFAGVFKLRGSVLEAGGGALVAALVFPFLTLLIARKRRHGKFGAQFPDAMDIIVRSLRAGHPVPVAIGLVAQELADPIGTLCSIATRRTTRSSKNDSRPSGVFTIRSIWRLRM